MSNTAEVTPYEPAAAQGTDIGSSLITAVASFLAEESDVVVRARDNYRAQCRDERLASVRPSSVTLNIADAASLVRAATSLGYAVVPSAMAPIGGASPVLLRNAAGQRIALHSTHGQVTLSGNALVAVHGVVREHTVQAVQHHLGNKWTAVKERTLSDGSLEIEAREPPSPSGERATLKARIGVDGRSHVDIDNVRGNRCETILKDYATVTGGKATAIKKKSAFFQMPGEPAKVKV